MDKKKKKEIYMQHKLEEYKELRAEIRHFLERRGQTINFAIIVSLGVIGVGFELKNYIMFYTAFILVWLLWYEEIRRLQSIIRTSAYIETVIEKELKGLSWETLNRKHSNQTNFLQRSIATAFYPVLLILNGSLGVYVMKIDNPSISLIIVLTILTIELVFIVAIFLRSHKIIMKSKRKEISEWNRIISK
jgi:antibiotic biosynthesis monooxygenase (ABM) superfamily enzyme